MSQEIIVVTGGAGFIGSNLCKRLAGSARVISLDNYFTGTKDNHVEGVEYREGHTKDIETLIPESPDLVYHLGEYSRVEKSLTEPDLVADLNLLGTSGVLEFWRKKKPKLVYAGSSTKFADGGLGRDQSPYAWSKAANTERVTNYAYWYQLPYATAYFYNAYGPGERSGSYGTVIEIFREKKAKGEPLVVTAPGTQRRNFTHVDDIVDGLLLIGERGEGDEFGLGAPESFSILEVAELFGGPISMGPEVRGNRMNGKVDTSKSGAIGWQAKRNLKDYIQKTQTT